MTVPRLGLVVLDSRVREWRDASLSSLTMKPASKQAKTMDYDALSRDELIERLRAEHEARLALEASRNAVSEAKRALHELAVHKLELEAQNQALREAQGLLEQSRSRYVDLYDFAPIGFCTLDRDAVVIDINLTGAAMLGRERASVIGAPFVTLVRLDDEEPLFAHVRRALASTGTVVDEIGLTTRSGSMTLQLLSAAVRDHEDRATRCRTALLDITAHRLTERRAHAAFAAERALRQRLQRIDRAVADVSATLAKGSRFDPRVLLQQIVEHARAITNARYAALGIATGYGHRFVPWVFSGMPSEAAERIGPTPRAIGLLGAVINAGRSIRVRELGEHPAFGGLPPHHPRMHSFLGVPIRYHDANRGNLYLADKQGADEFNEDDQLAMEILADRAAVALELARLRQVEAREHARLELLARAGPILAESIEYESTLEAIARLFVPEHADVTMIDLVDDGALRSVACAATDDVTQARLQQRPDCIGPEDVPPSVHEALRTGRPARCEITPEFLHSAITEPRLRALLQEIGAQSTIVAPLATRSGTRVVLRLLMTTSGRRYVDDDLPLVHDVAHHAALVIDNAALFRTAQSAIAARDSLIAIVSHDLRNYVYAAQLSAELLARGMAGSTPVETGRIGAVKHVLTRMGRLIESLADSTMIETGQLRVDPRAHEIGELLDELCATFQPVVEGQGIRMRIEVSDPTVAVSCDRERILQVLANLVDNAVKFTDEGGEVCVEAEPVDDRVQIAVCDSGRGITADAMKRVFDRWWRPAGQRGGTGLGLYIAHGIVAAHGSELRVTSEPGRGSRFYFVLDRARPVAPCVPEPDAASCDNFASPGTPSR